MEAPMDGKKDVLTAFFASIALALVGLSGLSGHYGTARNDDDDE
jgi:hypothetical protein